MPHFFKASLPATCGLCLAAALLPTAHGQNTTYWEEASGDFLTSDNWSDGAPGLGDGEQGIFYINNGGTANLSAYRKVTAGALGDGVQISPPNTAGTLNILAGGHLESVWIDAPGISGDVYVGGYGEGALNVFAGGQMTNYSLTIASQAGVAGVATLQGGMVTNSHDLNVGDAGPGTLAISDNGVATSLDVYIGKKAGSSGLATVSSGSLIATQNLSVGNVGSGTLTVGNQGYISSGTAFIGNAAGATGQVTLNGGTWNNTGDLFVGASGTGNVLVQGGGAFTVSGNATLSGTTNSAGSVTVDNGSMSVAQFFTIGEGAAGSVTVNSSGTLSAAAIIVSADSGLPESSLTVNGGTVIAGQIAGLSNSSLSFTDGTLRFTEDNPGYFAGFQDGKVQLNGSSVTFDTQQYHVATTVGISGTAQLVKTGGGRLGLSGASTYSGGTYLQAGEILIDNGSAIGTGSLAMDTAELRSTANATLALPQITVNSGHNGTFSTAANTTLSLNSGTFTLGANSMFRVGSAGNTGTVIFNATSAVAATPGTGIISIGYGTLRAGNQQLSALASQVERVFIVNGATLDFNDQTAGGSVNALFGEGTLHTGTQSTTTLTVQSGSFAGVISGAGTFNKGGSGTLIYSGTQISVGGITVSAGTLLLNGLANNVVVNGGTLGGTGTLEDVLTLSGGVLAPGESAGTLSAYAMEWAGGIMEFDLGPTSLLSDHLALTADLAGNSDEYLFHFLDEGAVIGTTYNLISFQNSNIAIEDFGLTNGDGFAGNFAYNGNVLQFTVTALPVPEPGTLGLFAIAALGALSRRRRS
jgi:fibronectin-binding autotransporter adhesin